MKLITKTNITELVNGIKQKFYSKTEIDQKVTEINTNIDNKTSSLKVGQDYNTSTEKKIFFKTL